MPREIADWDRLILRSPETALDLALGYVAARADGIDGLIARYAAGRAQFELGRIVDATTTLRAAVELVAGDGGPTEDSDRLEHVRISLLLTAAIVFAEAGDLAAALEVLDDAAARSSGVELGRVLIQRAVVLHHSGRLADALASFDRSDRLLIADADDRDRWRMHNNRGVVLLQLGELDAAESDFLAAIECATASEMTAAAGQSNANLGALYGRARRLFDALAAFDRADRLLDVVGRPERITTWMEIDRAEVMMHVGLVLDAVGAARRALRIARPSGNEALVGDALLMCARTELRAGLTNDAISTAAVALRHLRSTGRDDMAAHAESIRAEALLGRATTETADAVFRESEQLVSRLRSLQWHERADELTLGRLRAAWRIGAWSEVRVDIEELRLHAWGARRDLALMGWLAEAIARHADGDLEGSIAACTEGLDFLDEITAEATELEARSAAMRLGHDLSKWLIEVAVERRNADLALAATEGTRARALNEELDGRDRHRPLTETGAERLRTELRARLNGRSLVQWIVAGERVHAIVCDEGGNRVVDVADLRDVVRERDRMMVWLDLAAAEPDASSVRALRAAKLLDDLLIAPLALPDDHSLVVVPVDDLHGVPWSGLPSIADRPVVLTPSCRLWLDADRRASAPMRSVGFVAGPNLVDDDVELDVLRRCYARVDEATGHGATAATVRNMFAGHDLVHVAAHGRFRADRPLLSTFELADGEISLHETVPARVATRLAVLSSCEGGAHRGTGGSEVLGLASVLLARGATSVLAPLTVVRELECGEFVSAVHGEMRSGLRFGRAVADVRARWLRDDDLSRWAVASSFSCFGSGATRRHVG